MTAASAFKEAIHSVRSHFLPMSGAAPAGKAQAGSARDAFKPLVCPAKADPKMLQESEKPETSSRQDAIEEAHARGRQAGLAAGRTEAARSAEASLVPAANAFAGRIVQTSEAVRIISREGAAQSLRIALEIAEQVLGTEVQIAEAQRDRLHTSLRDMLADDCRLAISMHPEDLCILEELIASGAIEWSSSSSIEFRSDSGQQRGRIKAMTGNSTLKDLELQVDTIFTESISASAVSTK